jgi:hypothetical protein
VVPYKNHMILRMIFRSGHIDIFGQLGVGSYGTRNIVVIGMMVLGATVRVYCIVSVLVLIFRGSPFLGAFAYPCLYGRTMSQFPTNELFPVPTDFGV